MAFETRARAWLAGALALLGACALAPSAQGQVIPEIVAPWDGSIPFNCELQQAGTGTDFPDPDADPFCVQYDKTHQNLLEGGMLEFLLEEPARLARALDKCFYFQRDHWTAWVSQGEAPELYNWNGDYFFDIARGVGGVSVRNLRLAGIPLDATPFVPEELRPYFDPGGGGGVQVILESHPSYPPCAERIATPEGRAEVYRGAPRERDCARPGPGVASRGIGRLRLGMGRPAARQRLGEPTRSDGAVDRWCVTGGGRVEAAYRGGRVDALRTWARGHAARGVGRGDPARRARQRLDLVKRGRLGTTRLAEHRRAARKPRLILGVRQARVRWLAVADPRAARGREGARRVARRLG